MEPDDAMRQPTPAEVLTALDAALGHLSRALVETGTAERVARAAGCELASVAAGRAHEAAADAALQIASLRERIER